MFVVLEEYVTELQSLLEMKREYLRNWWVVAHGDHDDDDRSAFPTRAQAEEFAEEKARTSPNRFAVVEITSCYQREEPTVSWRLVDD